MITKNENGFGWGSLILAILFFIASWTTFQNPLTTLVTLGIVFGIVAIVQGIQAIASYFELKDKMASNPWYLILIGVIDGLVGFYLVFNPNVSVTLLPILFAVWFIVDSIMNIVLAFRLKGTRNNWFWLRLILGIIGIILGLVLIGNIFLAIVSVTYLIGFYFLIAGIIKLIDAFV